MRAILMLLLAVSCSVTFGQTYRGHPKVLTETWWNPTNRPSDTLVVNENYTIRPGYVSDSIEEAPIRYYTVGYGQLYNWFAVTDAKKITSSDDWIVPNDDGTVGRPSDVLWLYLSTGGGNKIREVGTTYWASARGTNTMKFNARGAGNRSDEGMFGALKQGFQYWSSVAQDATLAYYNTIYDFDDEFYPTRRFSTISCTKTFGLSVRLVKTSTTLSEGEEGSYVGNDGKVYKTICIGTQEWLAENLCETKYRDGTPIPEMIDAAEWAMLSTGARCCYNLDCDTYE